MREMERSLGEKEQTVKSETGDDLPGGPEAGQGVMPEGGGLLRSCWASVRAALFNRRALRDAVSVLERLDVREGNVVADIGSGGGFFAFELARLAGPTGRVFAVDVDEALLGCLARQARSRGVTNVSFLHSAPEGPTLPRESFDLLFMRNVFHHLADPVAFLRRIAPALKGAGRLAVVEWKPRRRSLWRHSTDEALIRFSAEMARFGLIESYAFLRDQSFSVFGRR